MVTSSQCQNRLADPDGITSGCLAIYGPAHDAQGNQRAAISNLIAKALNHEFGLPLISNFIQLILKLSHELGHRCLFSTTAAS